MKKYVSSTHSPMAVEFGTAKNAKANQLVSEHTVISQAQDRADEVLGDSYQEAAAIRSDADAYALEVLERIAAQLEAFKQTIDNGMLLLRSGEFDGGPDAATQTEPGVEPEIIGEDTGHPPN